MEAIIAELAKLGIAGLFIGYLIWNCREKDKRYEELLEWHNALQERRSQERAENARVLAESAVAQKDLAEAVSVAVETFAAGVRSMEATRKQR